MLNTGHHDTRPRMVNGKIYLIQNICIRQIVKEQQVFRQSLRRILQATSFSQGDVKEVIWVELTQLFRSLHHALLLPFQMRTASH